MMIWISKDFRAAQLLGFIPDFVTDADPRPAKEQFDANYAFGGGWSPVPGFTADPDGTLHFPDDPPMEAISEAHLRDEVIRVYEYAFVAIFQKDGSFEVARLD